MDRARTATATIRGISPYSQSAYIEEKKPAGRDHWEWEQETWKGRCNVNEAGHLIIPAQAFKLALSTAAKYRKVKIPGQGKAEYGKHFESGVQVFEPLVLKETLDTVQSERRFVPSNGRPGNGSRVKKIFPIVHSWAGEVTFALFDEIITKEIFEDLLQDAGRYIGVGRFRPENRGMYGIFEVVKVVWGTI